MNKDDKNPEEIEYEKLLAQKLKELGLKIMRELDRHYLLGKKCK